MTSIPIMQGSESDPDFEFTLDFEDTPPIIVINKQVERPLTEHTATPNVQVSDTEMLRLYVDNDLLERGVVNTSYWSMVSLCVDTRYGY